ncbi:unnamed protein product [Acanthoscelides obtectus]|uniref:Uncharacterized protein n=1 Tax=Acanthoscelides obtectus TaxID=200917 RepID=A0A9P0MC99_ACAOB|nr:unnamed protein product [Acanthoscelides obtectus]CAH2014162.1 unnamed protein product [Acanthoscelides obtectus]CAK1622305.1 hypothetical protein AOBTE_LOCUS1421 [Acanthoscelides obtectus]CAK1622311.1 hypothetical protein AOBTE_LOCUS1423 [Acanthoscelides obtectus]
MVTFQYNPEKPVGVKDPMYFGNYYTIPNPTAVYGYIYVRTNMGICPPHYTVYKRWSPVFYYVKPYKPHADTYLPN